ncbi:MAG TPA: CUAEP/CCAEP-tail radical SAM protein [Vicinamibacterales bacterium]|nr:CUAEP/CCAEP-tail radical SAM protein [Vicinamibacterales bacterium]
MHVLLISTYDMGRQSFGLASPAAWLREAGIDVSCADLSREPFPQDGVRTASLVAFFLPMHTATRLALPVIDRVRRLNPRAKLAAYGLYAPLNAELLRQRGVDEIFDGEFEEDLVRAATDPRPRSDTPGHIARLNFKTPVRDGLPALSRYAKLQVGAEHRVVGYTEASRGCKHRCRHCPIVPVYNGRFRIVSPDVVLADARAQVAAGAAHITFGDPDFFNGIRHAREVVERFARECPGVTYDVTIKVEHLLKHADALPLLRDTGCAFVTSAVEALEDRVLGYLEKGHTRADFERAVELCAAAQLQMSPTFVAFTPWTTIPSYLDFLQTIDRLGLVDHVAPIQLAIRLLVTDTSRLLELDDVRALVAPFDPVSLTHPWAHEDPRVDALHDTVSRIVGVRMTAGRADVFARVWTAAHAHAGIEAPARREMPVLPARATVPYLTEPWYC